MEESKVMQSAVNQAAIQGATSVMMVLRDADVGPRHCTNTDSLMELQKDMVDLPQKSLHLTGMLKTSM